MSKKIKDEQKKLLGQTLNEYDKALKEGMKQLDKKNREQNHKISALTNSFDNDFLEKEEENTMITLDNSKEGIAIIDELNGNTMVNYVKDGTTELILNGDIDIQGCNEVTITDGVDGGLVDVALEGNTMVNVCNQKDPVAITKSYTVETGNHVALQGEYDGKCRPVVNGNTLVDLKSGTGDFNFYCGGNFTDYTKSISDNSITATSGSIPPSWYYIQTPYIKTELLKPSTTYTVIFEKLENIKYIKLANSDTSIQLTSSTIPDGNKVVLTTKDTITNSNRVFVYCTPNFDSSLTATVGRYIILEGDYTNKPIPDYFEGLQSSFEDKVVTQEMVDTGEELAENLGKYRVDYKVTGKNKFDSTIKDGSVTTRGLTWSNDSDKNVVINGTTTSEFNACGKNIFNGIQFKEGVTYIASTTDSNVVCYISYQDDDGIHYCNQFTPYTHKSTNYDINVYLQINQKDLTFNNTVVSAQIEEGSTATTYEPYKESIKTYYLNSPLLEGDTIEESGNDVVHVHRSKEVVFDGSKIYRLAPDSQDANNIPFFTINFGEAKSILICDRLIVRKDTNDDKISNFTTNLGVMLDGNKLLRIKTGATTLDEFNTWISNNPLTVVYELASPTREVISQNDSILQDSYVGGSLDVDTAVPIEKVAFKETYVKYKYLYPNTNYTIQFESDNIGKIDNLFMESGLDNLDIVKGINKFNITTPANILYTSMAIKGIGFSASNIVVTEATDQDFGYFEGMKSVGECEDLEVVSCNSDGTLSNTQTLTHEPLRAVGDIKDKYVLIDGKWYIERNCKQVNFKDIASSVIIADTTKTNTLRFKWRYTEELNFTPTTRFKSDTFKYALYSSDEEGIDIGDDIDVNILKSKLTSLDKTGVVQWLNNNPVNLTYIRRTPVYEPIDYNPFEVYNEVTHISVNSTIPCNMTIKNTGYNCLLKPNTTYTVSSNLGLNVVTTPSTLTEDCLRFYDTDTSTVTKMKDVMVLEGDYTTGKPLPSMFSGMESAFEQEYDEGVGKYKVKAKVVGKNLLDRDNIIEGYRLAPGVGTLINSSTRFTTDYIQVKGNIVSNIKTTHYCIYDINKNPIRGGYDSNSFTLTGNEAYIRLSFNISDTNIQLEQGTETTPYEPYKEHSIEFYIDEPLRGIGDVKDKVYSDGDNIVIQRNCGQREYQDGDLHNHLTDTVSTVYPLASPTYEVIDCGLSKLILENYSNSLLILDTNIPPTVDVRYSGEVPVVTSAKTLSSNVDNTTIDINKNIIPYICDMDYRIIELQLSSNTQGEDVRLLGLDDVQILGNNDVLFNNRNVKKYNCSYDMLKRDILSNRYSKEEYQYRLERYLLAEKISDEEYKELEVLLNNGE